MKAILLTTSFVVFGLFFSLLSRSAEAAEYAILTDWVIDLSEAQTGIEESKRFFLGGLSREDESFYLVADDGVLTKRSIRSGEPLWQAQLKAESQGRWTHYEGKVFGGDADGNVYALDSATGEIIWSQKNKGVYFSAPLVRGQQMWIMNSFGELESYNTETGEWLWQKKDPEAVKLGLWSGQGPQFFGDLLIAGFPSGVLQVFDPASGAAKWSSSFRMIVAENLGFNDVKSISVAGEYLVASSFNGNLKVWRKSGASQKQIWEKKSSVPQPVSFNEDQSVFYASDRYGKLSSYEAESGYLQWEKNLPGGVGTTPSLMDGKIWLGTSQGQVFVYSLEGELIAQTPDLETEFYNEPLMLSSDEAVVLSSRGILRRFRLVKTTSHEEPSLARWKELF